MKCWVVGFLLMGLLAVPARATVFDLSTATIAEMNAAMAAGALSSERLVQLYLARIDAYDRRGPRLNAVITMNPEALATARALDAERRLTGPRSPLHGIPIVVKDLIDVAGLPTTGGFKPFGAPIPPRDAAIVAKLKAAGAIILAKVSTTNWFGKGFDETHPIGPSLNPYALGHSAGGSSNGVGVAVAAWFAAAGIGTDTGGSVMIPSSYCGIDGMVGTQGLVSRAGILPRGATQDRAGPMARNVQDLAALLSVISGWDAEDMMTLRGMGHFPVGDLGEALVRSDLKGRRIGVLREMIHSGPRHAEGLAVFEQALADLRLAGAVLVDPVLSGIDLKSVATASAGRTAEYEKIAVQNAYLERLGPGRPFRTIQEMIDTVGRDKFDRLMVEALSLESPAVSADYAARVRNKEMVGRLVSELMERYQLDAVVLPFSTLPPPRIDAPGGGGAGNSLVSNSGLPGIVVAAGYTPEGLPIALQITGRPFDDLALLRIAHGYERSARRRSPPATTPPLAGERFEY